MAGLSLCFIETFAGQMLSFHRKTPRNGSLSIGMMLVRLPRAQQHTSILVFIRLQFFWITMGLRLIYGAWGSL